MSADLVHSALAAIEVLPGVSNLLTTKCIKDLRIDGDAIYLSLSLGMPAAGLRASLHTQIVTAFKAIGASAVELTITADIVNNLGETTSPNLAGVKNIIAVASGKGGVGKSTTAVNVAAALYAEGAKVGLLDADIYGPSLQLMLGVADGVRPGQHEGKFLLPVVAHGLKTMSMAYLVNDKTPMVWRGPMASGALQQMLSQTMWEELDYLVVDMPPGTGDIQLTLSLKSQKSREIHVLFFSAPYLCGSSNTIPHLWKQVFLLISTPTMFYHCANFFDLAWTGWSSDECFLQIKTQITPLLFHFEQQTPYVD
jgi:ATP-binding protein involved in chromosome partitioning